MPAPEPLVAAFVAKWAGSVARTTVDNWVAGLSFWHTINGAPWNGARMLRIVCTAVAKTAPSAKPKRSPVTVEHLFALRKGLDLTNSFDAAVYAVACVAFWSCRRLGELVVPSTGKFDPERHVARSATVRFRSLPDGSEYAVFHVPWSKTTKQLGVDVIITEHRDPTSAVVALRHHLQANAAVPPSAPFFAFESTDAQGWSPMTRDWFIRRCNGVWAAEGLGELTGHCFRIGGATELLLRGTNPDIVAVQGGWKSRAFLEYWRKIESVLPLFISKSFDHSRLQLVTDSMSSFKKKYNL
ncbi:DNA breaking-rejoining enzyme [Amylocystis lapponica]|nr:DNA breaking-rejoining enzyme [Amylocystis lapponica]